MLVVTSPSASYNFNYVPFHQGFTLTGVQTNKIIYMPSPPNRFVLTNLILSVGPGNFATIKIFDEIDSPEEWIYIADLESLATNFSIRIKEEFQIPFISRSKENRLMLSINAARNVKGVVMGYLKPD